jgi:hypothetical protein
MMAFTLHEYVPAELPRFLLLMLTALVLLLPGTPLLHAGVLLLLSRGSWSITLQLQTGHSTPACLSRVLCDELSPEQRGTQLEHLLHHLLGESGAS